jgi:HSP90 family molecular chaperone
MRPRSRSSDYVSRMKTDQKAIYYLTADTLRGAQQPASGGVPRQGHRGAAAHRPHRRVGGRPSARVRGQDARERRERAADVASAIETPEKAAAESAFKDTLERLGKALTGKIASAQVSRA